MRKPLVTLVAICYNHARFLTDCLESIRQQTYANTEVIIVDDCSQDGSVDRIRDWLREHGLNWQLVVHDRNKGVCRALNDALSLAKGKYIACVAADDMWMPDKTLRQVNLMESLPDSVALVYSDAYLIDENGHRLPDMFIPWHVGYNKTPEGDLFADLLMGGNFFPAMTTLIRRSALEEVGRYDESLVYEDWDMWLRLSRRYSFAFDREVAASYRVLPGSLRTRELAIMKSDMQILSKWLQEPDLTEMVKKRVADLSWGLTQAEPTKRWYHASVALRAHRSLRSYGKLLLLLLGVRFKRAKRLARRTGVARRDRVPQHWSSSTASLERSEVHPRRH